MMGLEGFLCLQDNAGFQRNLDWRFTLSNAILEIYHRLRVLTVIYVRFSEKAIRVYFVGSSG